MAIGGEVGHDRNFLVFRLGVWEALVVNGHSDLWDCFAKNLVQVHIELSWLWFEKFRFRFNRLSIRGLWLILVGFRA